MDGEGWVEAPCLPVPYHHCDIIETDTHLCTEAFSSINGSPRIPENSQTANISTGVKMQVRSHMERYNLINVCEQFKCFQGLFPHDVSLQRGHSRLKHFCMTQQKLVPKPHCFSTNKLLNSWMRDLLTNDIKGGRLTFL